MLDYVFSVQLSTVGLKVCVCVCLYVCVCVCVCLFVCVFVCVFLDDWMYLTYTVGWQTDKSLATRSGSSYNKLYVCKHMFLHF